MQSNYSFLCHGDLVLGLNMTTYSLDAENFINEIKKYRELWDLSDEGNRYRTNVKHKAWTKVASVFIQDFGTLKDIEKYEVFRKLHNKWRNIRDAYVRHLKRKDGKRPYMYARLLTFLNQRYVNAYQSNSEDDSTDEDKKPDAATKPRVIEVTTCPSDDDATLMNVKRRRTEKSETSTVEFVETVPKPIQTIDFSQCTEDEDRSFFDSLLPAVRKFDLDQKLEFRCDVLKLIKQIRSNSVNYKTEPHTDLYDI